MPNTLSEAIIVALASHANLAEDEATRLQRVLGEKRWSVADQRTLMNGRDRHILMAETYRDAIGIVSRVAEKWLDTMGRSE